MGAGASTAAAATAAATAAAAAASTHLIDGSKAILERSGGKLLRRVADEARVDALLRSERSVVAVLAKSGSGKCTERRQHPFERPSSSPSPSPPIRP